MKIIKQLADDIHEELCDAQKYAELYIEYKSMDDAGWATRFRAMANDELLHAMNLHELAAKKIERLNKVHTPSQKMLDKWEDLHKEYVDKAAWIKQMVDL